MKRYILVVGATGQQGRATIDALFSSPSYSPSSIEVLALTRSATSPKSTALQAAYPDIILVEGDSRNPAPIFTGHPSISSVFVVTVPPNDEEQGLPLIEAAAAPESQVDHIVFSSVDRGGNEASWDTPTKVPHFAAKHRIEIRLRELCKGTNKRWTILRPTAFMDTYNPGFFGKFMASLWAMAMPADRRMQLISTHDIGIFAAKALLNPDEWSGKAVALAGDNLSFGELQQAFHRATGQELPQTYGVLTLPVLWWVKDASMSFEWFNSAGWAADINELRKQEPGLQTFEKWLKQSSKWKENN